MTTYHCDECMPSRSCYARHERCQVDFARTELTRAMRGDKTAFANLMQMLAAEPVLKDARLALQEFERAIKAIATDSKEGR